MWEIGLYVYCLSFHLMKVEASNNVAQILCSFGNPDFPIALLLLLYLMGFLIEKENLGLWV